MLITEEYRAQNRALHEDPNKSYGVMGRKYAPLVGDLYHKHGCKTVLDYGSGKGGLAKASDLPITNYDPAIPEFSDDPEPADLVACLDVLEHIEPECIEEVLDHLQSLALMIGLFSVSTQPAAKTLPDGRNAHVLQRPPEWWLPKIMDRFELSHFVRGRGDFVVVVNRKTS